MWQRRRKKLTDEKLTSCRNLKLNKNNKTDLLFLDKVEKQRTIESSGHEFVFNLVIRVSKKNETPYNKQTPFSASIFFFKQIKAGGKQEERENEINYTLRQSKFRFTTPNSRTHTTFLYELQGSSAVNTTRVLALRQSYVRRLVEKTFRAPHLVKTPSSELAELKKKYFGEKNLSATFC